MKEREEGTAVSWSLGLVPEAETVCQWLWVAFANPQGG